MTPATTDLPTHLLFPLASSLLYVAAALSLKRASEQGAGVWRSTFVMNVTAAACFAVMLLLGPRGPGPTPLWQPVVVGALFVLGQALTMVALSRGDVSVATPVVGTKVVFVALFVTLIAGDRLIVDYWVSAAMSALGIVLLNAGGSRRGGRRNLGLTIVASLAAASCYALFDVLVRKWAPSWGVGRLLPAVMFAAAALSLALWPLFEGPLTRIPRAAWGSLGLGCLLLATQALLLTRTLGLHPDTTRINIVYNSRGLWSVVAVWLVGHWWGNTERHAGRAVLLWRLAGAALLLGAIVVAVAQPIRSARVQSSCQPVYRALRQQPPHDLPHDVDRAGRVLRRHAAQERGHLPPRTWPSRWNSHSSLTRPVPPCSATALSTLTFFWRRLRCGTSGVRALGGSCLRQPAAAPPPPAPSRPSSLPPRPSDVPTPAHYSVSE